MKNENKSIDTPYAQDPRWLLIERILATPDFERSPRLSDFLRHIGQLALEGRSDEISEQHLGEVVFGRAPGYDSSADTIVRSHALRLRHRLDEYFLREGREEPLRLVVPRGGYVPEFIPQDKPGPDAPETAQALQPVPALSLEQIPETQLNFGESPNPSAKPGKIPNLVGYRVALAGSLVLVLLLAIALGISLRHAQQARVGEDRNHLLWSRLFTADEPTQIVLGDSGLVLFHAVARRYVSLQDYVSGDLSKQIPYVQHVDSDFARFLAGRRYTSFVDASTATRLLRLPEATPNRTLVHFSRDMQIDDFKTGNIIVIGAQEANPWVELFERSMDFVFTIDTPNQQSAFLNRHPQQNELSLYPPTTVATIGSKTYAVIAFLPNLSAKGNVLLLEGITMAGTESAVDLVLDDERLLPLLHGIRRVDGSLPYFEILLECDNLKESAGPTRVVGIHVHSS